MVTADGMAEKIQSLMNDEESMRQIKELAEMFGGSGSGGENVGNAEKPSEEAPHSSAGLLDGITPTAIMSLMSSFSESDPNCDLIMALKPLLSKDKQQKADKAIKMLKLYNVYISLKESGMLNDLF